MLLVNRWRQRLAAESLVKPNMQVKFYFVVAIEHSNVDDFFVTLLVVGLESLIENQCRLTGSSLPSTSANILCSVLKSFAKSEQRLFLETSEERVFFILFYNHSFFSYQFKTFSPFKIQAKLNVIISVGKHFATSNKFSSRIFAKNLNKKVALINFVFNHN